MRETSARWGGEIESFKCNTVILPEPYFRSPSIYWHPISEPRDISSFLFTVLLAALTTCHSAYQRAYIT